MTADELTDRNPVVELLLFALIALMMLADLASDAAGESSEILHVALEALVMLAALAGVLRLWGAAAAARGLARASLAEAERWQREARAALDGMAAAIEQQFAEWQLTEAERAVGFLLLRGLSHKEVAGQRQTSERTVRQQALAVYRKANVRSRAELSAFFMRGLPVRNA